MVYYTLWISEICDILLEYTGILLHFAAEFVVCLLL